MKKSFIILLLLYWITASFITVSYSLPIRVNKKQKESRELKADKKQGMEIASARQYHALVIGNNDYLHLPSLGMAKIDAEVVSKILKDTYGFETKLLINANRDQILRAFNQYRHTLDEDTSLLIYYAGHGHYDKAVDKAYWLPVDAEDDNTVQWISSDDVTTNIRGILAKHIIVISDSCYSGLITRGINTKVNTSERKNYIQKMFKGTSRTLMSSGGNEPVLDGGGSGHSVFARALLRGLEEMDYDVFPAEELFYKFIRESVGGKAKQTPQYKPINNSGHDAGDFVFIRKIPRIIKVEPEITVQGKWKLKILTGSEWNEGSLSLFQTGNIVSGFIKDIDNDKLPILAGEVKGNKITLTARELYTNQNREDKTSPLYNVKTMDYILSGYLNNNTIIGTYVYQVGPMTVTLQCEATWAAPIDPKSFEPIEVPSNTEFQVELQDQVNIDQAQSFYKFNVRVVTPAHLVGATIDAQVYKVLLAEQNGKIGILLAFDYSQIELMDGRSGRFSGRITTITNRNDIKVDDQGIIPISDAKRFLGKGTRLKITTNAKTILLPQ